MIKPFLTDDAFLADVGAAPVGLTFCNLWWLGQSGFLLKSKQACMLIDPYLSDSLTKKYAATDKPHVRISERVVDPVRLDFIDITLSTHNHTDHLDPETLDPLIAVNPAMTLVTPEANRDSAADRLNLSPSRFVGLDDREGIIVNTICISGVPAAHNDIDRDEFGRCRYLGYVIRGEGWAIYHSGDTLWHEEILRAIEALRIEVDVAILPINGNRPERRVAGNLNGTEAAQFARRIGAKCVIPCHYDMFEFNTAPIDDFVETCKRIGQRHKVLRLGERWCTAEDLG